MKSLENNRLKKGSEEASKIKETPGSLEATKEKLLKKLRRVFQIFTFTTLLTSAVGIVDHKLTRYRVTEKEDGKGGIEYIHEDAQTTHNINILAGKEKLTELEQEKLLKEADKDTASIITDPDSETFNQELYNALWKLEQENGNPKVKFTLHTSELQGQRGGFYLAPTNTMVININYSPGLGTYIAELSHAQQFDKNPLTSYLKGLEGITNTIVRAATHHLSFRKAYDGLLYNQVRSIELEAHRVIEPILRSELENLTPKYTAQAAERRKQDEVEAKKNFDEYSQQLEAIFQEQKKIYNNNNLKPEEKKKLLEELSNHSEQIEKEFKLKKETLRKILKITK